ncbi:MAG: hypothetical protein U0O04_01655 [Clostridia bacterium]|nr:hypothetical protein [Clostridiaceae bacterium]
MTNINCSSDCVYQKDGKCCYENILAKKITPSADCAYYLSKKVQFERVKLNL